MSIFRAYDIRGIVPTEFDAARARTITRAYITYLAKDPTTLHIGVARDNRTSSAEIHSAVVETLSALGVQVTDMGLASTPAFYFGIDHLTCDGGIQITASHNPAQYNGMKLVGPHAIPIGQGSGMEEIAQCYEHLTTDLTPHATPGIVTPHDITPAYIETHLTLAHIAPDEDSSLRMIVDTGNGVSALMADALIRRLSLHADTLYFELDGTFPHRAPDPLAPGNLSTLQSQVVFRNADFGIAFDADGDRIVVTDEKGAIIPADILTALLTPEILALTPHAKIGADVRSSHIVTETITTHGGIPVTTRVGHAFIKRQMRAEDIAFVGELSGHFYFKSIGYYEAPLLIWLLIIKLLTTHRATPLSALIAPLKKYVQSGEKNFIVLDKEEALTKIETRFAHAREITHLDGVTITFDDWWCNIRPSNTENLLRLNLEANTPEILATHLAEIEQIIAA